MSFIVLLQHHILEKCALNFFYDNSIVCLICSFNFVLIKTVKCSAKFFEVSNLFLANSVLSRTVQNAWNFSPIFRACYSATFY